MTPPPSFASFPSFAETATPSASDSKNKSERSIHSLKEKKEKREKRDRKERNVDETGSHRHDALKLRDEDQPRAPYYADRKGDPLNLQYGSSGEKLKYKLVDRGRKILGLSKAWSVTSRTDKVLETRAGSDRYIRDAKVLTDRKTVSLLSAPARKVLSSQATPSSYEEIEGVIHLTDPKRTARSTHKTLESASESSDEEVSSEEDDSSAPVSSHHLALRRVEEDLAADPSSVEKWLELLERSLSSVPLFSRNATKSRAEITVSILNRALSSHPQNRSSSLLRMKLLNAGEEVWHQSKLNAEWEDVLKLREINLWIEWINWKARSSSLDDVLKSAQRALSVLEGEDDDEIGRLRIFWRVAVLQQEAGFVERATAMFQAQAELTFEVPQSLYGLAHEKLLDSLEEFWDSDAPRTGDPEALGWSAWYSTRNTSGTKLRANTSPPLELDSSEDPHTTWARQEDLADSKLIFPVPLDAADDPYSSVLFSDIRDFLLPIKTNQARDFFRMAWLSFAGLMVPGLDFNWDDRWACGPWSRPEFLSRIFPSLKDVDSSRLGYDSSAGVSVGREMLQRNSFGPAESYSYGLLSPLHSDFQGAGKSQSIWSKEDVVHEDHVRNIFRRLRLGSDDSDWDALALAFESAVNVTGAIKLSKLFLSESRDSIRHWVMHAHLERIRGRMDAARKVYQTFLGSPKSQDPYIWVMWWDYAEMKWLSGDSHDCLRVLFSAAGVFNKGSSESVGVLRSRQFFTGKIDSLTEEEWKEHDALIKLLALLELISSQDLEKSLRVFDEYISHVDQSEEHESLTLASILFAYRHVTILKNPTPPSVLRDRVLPALRLYPNNTVILGLFLEGEKRQGVWSRVKTAIYGGDTERMAKTVVRRVEEVRLAGWQVGRWRSEIERIRTSLEIAVVHERTRGCPTLWRIMIELEIRERQLSRGKKLFYRAIAECPLVKGLYLLAFGPLREAFDRQELQVIGDRMAELVRLRTGLDEVEENMEVDDGRDSSDEREESEIEDEVERRAKEIWRLMPY